MVGVMSQRGFKIVAKRLLKIIAFVKMFKYTDSKGIDTQINKINIFILIFFTIHYLNLFLRMTLHRIFSFHLKTKEGHVQWNNGTMECHIMA